MLRRRVLDEDTAVLIDMAPRPEKGDSYGSTARPSEVTLHTVPGLGDRGPSGQPFTSPSPGSRPLVYGGLTGAPEPPPPSWTQGPEDEGHALAPRLWGQAMPP